MVQIFYNNYAYMCFIIVIGMYCTSTSHVALMIFLAKLDHIFNNLDTMLAERV